MNNRFKGNTIGFQFDFMNYQGSSSNGYVESSLQAASFNYHSQFFDANGANVEQQDMNNSRINEEDASYLDTSGYLLQTETDAISCPITNNQDAFNDREANTMAAPEDMGDLNIQDLFPFW